MKKISTFCVFLLATSANADTASVVQSIVDRNLTNKIVSESYIKSDGTVIGVANGTRYEGTWEIKGGKYCRVIPTFNVNGCQTVVQMQNAAGKLVGVEFRDPGKSSGNRYFLK